jgi:Fur family ferric uptake transcriptional regulator
VLSRVQGFVSAQDLHGLITKDGGPIALATVYTQLKKLSESGEVDLVMTDRGETLYRRCVIDVHHHHLACRDCGAAVEVDAPELEDWAHEISERYGYRDLRHVLELNGICTTCQSR